MNCVIIHGQSHEGSTCHIARLVAEKLGGEVSEFFLPRDFGDHCTGCTACFVRSETCCPHYDRLKHITAAIDAADVIILASPVYVYHVTSAMKAFFDHYGYRWMVHRPEAAMFRKRAVCISTAAGGGTRSAIRDMADSTFFWGVAKTYRLGMNVQATSWDGIKPEKREKAVRMAEAVANKIRRGRARPALKTKVYFAVMRMMQKCGWNAADMEYWKEKGWLAKARPWK